MSETEALGDEATQEAAMEATQGAIMEATQEASEESKRTVVVFNEEDELNLMEFLKDNELRCNKRLTGHKDQNKREAVWDRFCTENNMEKAACKR